jgi:hypothetical protein
MSLHVHAKCTVYYLPCSALSLQVTPPVPAALRVWRLIHRLQPSRCAWLSLCQVRLLPDGALRTVQDNCSSCSTCRIACNRLWYPAVSAAVCVLPSDTASYQVRVSCTTAFSAGPHNVLSMLASEFALCCVLAGKEAAAARRTAARFTTWLAKYADKQKLRRRTNDDILTRLSKVRGRLCTIAVGLCGSFCSLWQAAAAVPQSRSGQGSDDTLLWGGALCADEPC